jgi:hypothetical protein
VLSHIASFDGLQMEKKVSLVKKKKYLVKSGSYWVGSSRKMMLYLNDEGRSVKESRKGSNSRFRNCHENILFFLELTVRLP